MTNEENSPCYFPLELIPGLVDQIWAEILPYKEDKWSVPKNKKSLVALVGQTKTTQLYAIENKATQNVELRKLLSPLLKGSDFDIRLEAMRWVIYDWGHVRGKRGSERDWPEKFGSYETSVIENFIKSNNHYRIASWSKALAFADSSTYAIYDARVAMSLNSILDKIRHERKFYMPPPSSPDLGRLFTKVKEHVRAQYEFKQIAYMGYSEYRRLLNAIVQKGLAPNVLEVEMRLFANSDIYEEHYKTRHGL
jgi:hypothetical protein